MPSSYDCRYRAPHYTVRNTTYTDTASQNYYARLSEKAAPAGTIHLNSYEAESSQYYRQPVYYARPPATRVVKEVVTVREPPPPTRVVHEKVVVKEPVREPVRQPVKMVERRVEKVGEVRERGFVRGVAGRGVGAMWRALGGQSRVR